MHNRRNRPDKGNGNRNDRGNRKDGKRPDRGRRRFGFRDGNNNRGSEGQGFVDQAQSEQEQALEREQNRGRGRGGKRGEIRDFFSTLLRPGEDHDFLEKTPCPACGNLQARIKGRLGPTLLRKCRSCSLVYISPRLATSVREEMLRREPSPISSERNLWLRDLNARRMERMHREMPAATAMNRGSASLMEIGCRWGHFLQLCRPHYRSVEGLEWSKQRVAFARDRFDLQVSATDIFRDPWKGRYNIIVAWDLMEREPHPLEFLRWVHDHLEADGQLVLSTPNYASLARFTLRTRWFHFEPSRHLCYFTPSTLKALLREAGFRDVKIRTSGLPSLRDWFSDINKVDRNQDAREQWLESLRGREAVEARRREGHNKMGRPNLLKKALGRIAGILSGILTAPGWGDEMRVYAKRS